jgi:hypothetical protein
MAIFAQNPLEKLNEIIEWKEFRTILNEVSTPKEQ